MTSKERQRLLVLREAYMDQLKASAERGAPSLAELSDFLDNWIRMDLKCIAIGIRLRTEKVEDA